MEGIQIGRGPDFCMLRGRSLAMILKEIRQNVLVVVNDLILDMPLNKEACFKLSSHDRKSYFYVQLYLPEDLLIIQAAKIIGIFGERLNSRL